jgi:rhodanese-related sulfurtransferase
MGNLIVNLILLVIILAMVGEFVWSYFRVKWAATVIDEETFRKGMRKAQVIDVRDKADFDAGHILGARNIPAGYMKQLGSSLRKDQPVYLYDKRRSMSGRAAITLKKQGFKDLFILKEGFDGWTGKVKRNTTIHE